MTSIGVIGGSGLYKLGETIQEHNVATPWGETSAAIREIKLGEKRAFFLPRHGDNHQILPSELPSKANIYALKSLGVTHLLSVSAVGIMREDISPGDFVIPSQIIDRTRGIRPSTFFGEGCVGHVSLADPFCSTMKRSLLNVSKELKIPTHVGGTYICIEGPQFSSRAESLEYRRNLDPSIIGMTAIPEARLAREAEISYSLLAMATDYDCWHESEDDVTADAVIQVIQSNSKKAASVVAKFISEYEPQTCSCHSAAAVSIMTPKSAIPPKTIENLSLFYGKYWEKS